VFNPGWREKQGIDYGDLVLPDTGEHLTKQRFDELHNSSATHWVLIFSNTQEMVDKVIPHPLVMIASDGIESHPRNAGTYSRVLAQYVREKGTVTLMDAIRKMSLMPAEMLERSTPAARQKGRLQEGADADIVVFDANTITDRATFEKPMEPSVGVRYLAVGELCWWTKASLCGCVSGERFWGRAGPASSVDGAFPLQAKQRVNIHPPA